MAERKLDQLRRAAGNFLQVELLGVVWGICARVPELDPLDSEAWESLVPGSYLAAYLGRENSPVRRRALRCLSAKDQKLAHELADLGFKAWCRGVPTPAELVRKSREYAQATGSLGVPLSELYK